MSPILQDSIYDYYNNDTSYITFTIHYNQKPYDYISHYYGGKEYWDTSKTSRISIVYAWDENRNGGSEGNGGVKRSNNKFRKRLTEPFEQEFIQKIDSLLGLHHSEE